MPDECRPPPNTPDGTVCVLRSGITSFEYEAVWVDGLYHRPHPDIPGAVIAYTPEELAIAGYRFHSIAEPPGDE